MRRALRMATLVVAGVLVTSGCDFDGAYDLPLPGSPVDADHAITVTAEFEDILNVVPRSPVMVDDVTVGEVTEVERVGWHARVTMRVRDDVVLPDDAIADIRQVSLLGEKYVALEAPSGESATAAATSATSGGRLGDGDHIPLAATGRNPEVEEVLGALSYLLSGGGVAQLATITTELNNAMSGREEDLRNLLGTLNDVVGTLDDQKADIIRALESVNSLTKTLNAERGTLTAAIDAVGPAVEVLADQHDELIEMLDALDELGTVGTRVIEASRTDLLKTLDHLHPVLEQLRAAGDDLGPGLNLLLSFPFPQEASEVVRGDYANTSIRAEISLDNVLPPGVVPTIPIPPIPVPTIPPLGGVAQDVVKCLESADLTSQACRQVLADVDLLGQLRTQCQTDTYRTNPVCTVLNAAAVPGTGSGSASGGGLGGLVGGLLPGLGSRAAPSASYGASLSSGDASAAASQRALLSGGTS